ncbi:MAG: BMP family lipoprotein [Lentihominibacter sp.]|jgi:basic membrane protein A
MKRFISFITTAAVALAMVISFAGCKDNSSNKVQPEEMVEYEIAMITDDSLVMDGGHSEAAWNAITEFGAGNGISHKYYKATEATKKAYKGAINTAVEKGAKVIVFDGYTFDDTAVSFEDDYSDVNFVVLNATPVDEETGKVGIADNITAIHFESEQTGFLAGYAAVAEGYTRLGFIGESEVDLISGFGYGYVKGADRAAGEAGIDVEIRYLYCDAETAADAFDMARTWYEEGTEVIFACGHGVEKEIIRAAESAEGKVIGSCLEKTDLSDTVIATAVHDIKTALERALYDYKEGELETGVIITYDVNNSGVYLAVAEDRMINFGSADAEALREAIADGEINVKMENITDPELINAPRVKIIR